MKNWKNSKICNKKKAEKVVKYARKSEKKSEKNVLVPAEIAEICKNMQNKYTGFGTSVVWNAQIPKGT